MPTPDDDERRNRAKIAQLGPMLDAVFASVAAEAHRSIQDGSELTGAPGQPVDTGYLKNSIQLVMESKDRAVIGTNTVYAESIEEGRSFAHGGKPMVLRSPVGGFHSFKLTHANLDRIVAHETRRIAGGAK